MRLSSVVVAVVLLFSSVVFAQHSSSGGGGSSGGSSGGGSHGSSGGGNSSGSSSHAGSSGGSSGGGSSHSAGSHSSTRSSGSASAHTTAHNSGSSSRGSSAAAAESRSKASSHSAAAKTAQPGKRGFFSFLRRPFHRPDPKPTESDLRGPVCKGDCRKPAPKAPETATLVESDLRRPICKGKACACPPGEVQGKNGGCVAAPTNNSACVAGQSGNNGACAASAHQCSPDTYWNGASCVGHQAGCATINARAASLANEVRAARTQMQSACTNNSAQDCSGLKQNYDGAVERYRMLMNEAPANCRSLVPDPLSL
jgi:hypothetical protein